MSNQLASRLCAAVILIAGSAASLSAAALSGATAFGAGTTGVWTSGITATGGCCQGISVEQGAFTAGANPVTVPVNLVLGSNIFYLESSVWSDGWGVTTGGVNLFFNGSATPGISAHVGPTHDQTDFSQAFSATGNTVCTANLVDACSNGSGTLSYTSGGTTIQLIGLQWEAGGTGTSYSTGLTVQRVDLYVTGSVVTSGQAPEPGTVLLFGAGLAMVGLVRRKRRV